MKCPNCGAEIGKFHKGLTPKPENYIIAPLNLTPGKKYDRRFSLLFLPPKILNENTYLGCALVIASEEVKKDTGQIYVAGSKFYDNELSILNEAVNRILAAEVAFRSIVTDRELYTVLNNRLNDLYRSNQTRERLVELSSTMLRSMRNALRLSDSIGTISEEGV